MGKKPAEIQREIAQQRSNIERRLHSLEDRVADDVRDAGHAFSEEVGERTHINQYAEQRPMTTVLGAFGAGVFLGMMSGRGARQSNGRKHASSRYESERGGLFDDVMGAASGAIGGSLQTEVRQLIRDVLGTDGRDSRGDGQYTRDMPDRLDTGAVGAVQKAPERFRP